MKWPGAILAFRLTLENVGELRTNESQSLQKVEQIVSLFFDNQNIEVRICLFRGIDKHRGMDPGTDNNDVIGCLKHQRFIA